MNGYRVQTFENDRKQLINITKIHQQTIVIVCYNQ